MQIYNYDRFSGEYLFTSYADPNPLEPGKFLIPAFATELAPPEVQENEVRVFENGGWKIHLDFRESTYWGPDGERKENKTANWNIQGVTLSENLQQIVSVDYVVVYEHSSTYGREFIIPIAQTATEDELIASVKVALGDTRVEELNIDTSVSNQDLWRAFPITERTAEEQKAVDAKSAREVRNSLLSTTDFYALSDVKMTDEMIAYRSALRNVPQQDGFPASIIWPTKP